jgi:tRNA uridine 5-carbamoylmethylation protein Kti12
MIKTLILTVGLPRAGKSTWARAQGLPMVQATMHVMVRALFDAGHDAVILDQTNFLQGIRDEWYDEKWHRLFRVFDTTKEVCIERARVDRPELIPLIDRLATSFEWLSEDEWFEHHTTAAHPQATGFALPSGCGGEE